MNPVSLADVAERFDMISEDFSIFLNTKTGEFVDIRNDYLRIAEEYGEEDEITGYFDWEVDLIREAMDIEINWEDYVSFPSQYDLNEYSIMTDFAYSIDDQVKKDKLLTSLDGRGAFRRFKNSVCRLGIEQMWYAYLGAAFKEFARDWCEQNEIPYIE